MSIQFRLKSLCFLLGLLLVVVFRLAIQITTPILAQDHIQERHYYVPDDVTPTFTIEQGGLTAEYPDWQRITFSRLNGSIESGELLSQPSWDRAVGYYLSRIWDKWDSPAEFLKLGDFQGSLVEGLNLEYILNNSLTEIDINSIKLSALGLMRSQTIDSLVRAIPKLRNLRVGQVRPILALVGEDYAYNQIGDLVDTSLGNLSFGRLNLNRYSLRSIPGLLGTPLSRFKGWKNSFLEEVPGLWDLPFNYLFGNGIFTAGLIAKADIAFGTAEAGLDNTISGSYEEGFSVPCETECAHVELGNFALGKRWISGKYQKVKGGRGLLGLINGGKEPTGRHPFGKWAKVAVWETNESEGSVDTALFFRYCQKTWFVDLGCTPFFLGPIPFLSYHEKDNMIIGLLDGAGGSSDTNPIPPPPVENQPLPPKNASELINPLPDSNVTSEFGYRNVEGGSRFHTAIDLAYTPSDPRAPGQIIASGDGVIARVKWAGRCGNWIRIEHPNGLATGYCHMSATYVERGKSVSQGQVIGQVGSTGASTGDHLHFIIYEGTKQVNPRKYVNF